MTTTFDDFFRAAMADSDRSPYPYQRRLADEPLQSRLIHVPTGCGKTGAVILAWLWRRKFHCDSLVRASTPRRLVYCLPMRVLVEQTRDNAERWLNKLVLGDQVGVHVLMGGEEADDWDLYPERDAILIGTQDMLLSRALNRGYGMSRYRWPMHFGLLHMDCLWVFDEVQLMGSGLATTAQLEAFRSATLGSSPTWWMSATLDRRWLETVDYKEQAANLRLSKLEDDDLAIKPDDADPTKRAKASLQRIRKALKPLQVSKGRMGDASGLANEIVTAHRNAGGLTLVVVNTVGRARELHDAVSRESKAASVPVEPILIHSRFRPPDRKRQIDQLLAEPRDHATIVISTQVVEAGVDVSARTLFTELAPWPSLVQRFGRCNRRGLDDELAQVFWIDLSQDKKEQEKVRHPYELSDLTRSRELLSACKDVSPASLETIPFNEQPKHKWVIRKKDFIDLFDTTPDLAGNDIDVDRYVRDIDESDVQVFWREWQAEQQPPDDEPRPRRDELCSVPIGEFKQFVKARERRRLAYRWDYLDRKWVAVNDDRIYPGQIYLLHSETGGYKPDLGWNVDVNRRVEPVLMEQPEQEPESYDDERLSELSWQSIAVHTNHVCSELEAILNVLPLPESQALRLAARWHDWGKVHCVFQEAVDDGQAVERRGVVTQRRERPLEWKESRIVAKAPGKIWKDRKLVDVGFWRRYERKHFRHELASALAVLQRPLDGLASLGDDDLNLVAYLVAAHHGKVRLSIRSLPGEKMPSEDRRFARGVWDGDGLPAVDLGGGVTAPAVTLSLEPMELGLCEQPPFAGTPSWAERMLSLRDKLGPCRLAYLEAMLRAADMRASKDTESKEKARA